MRNKLRRLPTCLILLALACSKQGSEASAADLPEGETDSVSEKDGGTPQGGTSADSGRVPYADHPSVLYQRSGRVRSLGIDEQHLYWTEVNAEGSQVIRARKDGSGGIEPIGSWGMRDIGDELFATDMTHVYWLDTGKLAAYDKEKQELEHIDLHREPHQPARLAIDETTVYIAERECAEIGRVTKADRQVTWTPLPEGERRGGGSSSIAVDDENVYCGDGPSIFVMRKDGSASHILVDDQEQAAPLTVDATTVYWANGRPVLSQIDQANLAMAPKAGGDVVDLGRTGWQIPNLLLDQSRRQIFYVRWQWQMLEPIMAYSLDQREFEVVAEDQPTAQGSSVQDENFIYWLTRHAVHRLEKPSIE